MTQAVIPPVRTSVRVARPPEEVFRVFTQEMGQWWPLQTHSIAVDSLEGKVRAETVVFDGWAGGHIYERMDDGREADWGHVLVWEPPHRVVFSWKPNLTRGPHTEVEVRFSPEGAGTRVDLEHRGWERLRPDRQPMRDTYETGWPEVLDKLVRHLGGSA